jgi:hypothetical protein
MRSLYVNRRQIRGVDMATVSAVEYCQTPGDLIDGLQATRCFKSNLGLKLSRVHLAFLSFSHI